MLYKVVFKNQIRLFEVKDGLTFQNLREFVSRASPKMKRFTLYYLDEDQDHIMMESKEDVAVYLEYSEKKPKIYVQEQLEEQEVFDSNTEVIAKMSEFKLAQIVSEKEEEPAVKLSLEKEEKVEIILDDEPKEEQEVDQPKEEKSIIVHNVICNDCGVHPIVGIRFKCSVCGEFDLCEECQGKTSHQEDHPFVKIRDPSSAPLSVEVQLEQEDVEGQGEEKEKVIKVEIEKEEEVELIFENRQEKKVVISSYLESVFGPDDTNSYQQFANMTCEKTEQRILESYILWVTRKNESEDNNIFAWLSSKAKSAKNNFDQFFRPNDLKQKN